MLFLAKHALHLTLATELYITLCAINLGVTAINIKVINTTAIQTKAPNNWVIANPVTTSLFTVCIILNKSKLFLLLFMYEHLNVFITSVIMGT